MSTKIEWVKNQDGTQGKSWNVVTGCTKVSPGCKHCYAERMARRLAGRSGYPAVPHHFDVTLRPERLKEPLKRKKPTTYFVCSMSDLFHEDVPTHYIADVWNVMRQCPQHTFQVLTKRPYPMLGILQDWDVVLPNVWLGVSVENQAAADERIHLLLQTPAVVWFVSAEPLLGPIDLREWLWDGMARDNHPKYGRCEYPTGAISWVIVGGESGPGARPMHPQWARGIRDQCRAADIPFFFKQWGAWAPYTNHDVRAQQWHWFKPNDGSPSGEPDMHRIGKKAAGRVLDGRTHDELPRRASARGA